jgi:integrase
LKWPPQHLPKGFPLTIAKRGYVVTVAGKTRWVCGKKTAKEALAIYARKLSAWQSNETPIPVSSLPPDSPTLHYILARWVLDRRGDAQRGEIRGASFDQCLRSAKRIDLIAGSLFTDEITPDTTKSIYGKFHQKYGEDFARRAIGHLRTCAREAADRGWCRPIRIGNNIVAKLTARPQPRMKWRLYTAVEIRAILLECNRRIRRAKSDGYRAPWEQLKAMILLALNGGYGARELSELPRSVIDLEHNRIDHARGKTGAQHVVPLWPETVRALRVVMSRRLSDELLFRTRAGNPWAREEKIYKAGKLVRTVNHDNVAWAFNELVKGIGLKIEGQSFYKIKHLHATTADKAGDPHATFALAGHALPGSRSHYVRIDELRLREVVDFVRHHLILKSSRQ